MAFWILATLAAGVLVVLYFFGFLSSQPKPPKPKNGWWGRGPDEHAEDESIREFKVEIPDADLDDLRKRLESWRHGEDLEDTEFQYGFLVREMKIIVEHWKNDFDWRKQEAILNSFPQFKTTIEGLEVHFLRVKPPSGRKGKPLLIVHGWPGSVWEFYKMIPMLTDPASHGGSDDDAFEVIAPSIPGYGFSEGAHRKGFGRSACAGVFVKLMKRLGYDRFYTQGGDWGAAVTTCMAIIYPENIIGYHNNLIIPNNEPLFHIAAHWFPGYMLGEEHREHFTPFWKQFMFLLQESGYYHINATKPDTVSMALNDSPVGLAAYILEKFSTWTNREFRNLPDGGLFRKYSLDELLTNVMIYWFSGNVAASARFYKENFNSDRKSFEKLPVKVPVGLAAFPEEIVVTTLPQAKRKYKDVVQFTYMPRGGHFAAFEEPEILAKDIISFVRKLHAR